MLLHIIRLKNVPIYDQLLLEERLLREENKNFCLLSEGSCPAVVMGISGKMQELVDEEKTKNLQYPVIKRFSGGGTVVIDENTLFVSFICNKQEFSFPIYPEPILRWSEKIYADSWQIPHFTLRENDFVIQHLKCGGNAQYITKDRFVQHTSFLWDFSPHNMECLKHPPKAPSYRAGRKHTDFLCTLQPHFPSKEAVFSSLEQTLSRQHTLKQEPFSLQTSPSCRISTCFVSFQ
jgi:lipoate-protein ligase A